MTWTEHDRTETSNMKHEHIKHDISDESINQISKLQKWTVKWISAIFVATWNMGQWWKTKKKKKLTNYSTVKTRLSSIFIFPLPLLLALSGFLWMIRYVSTSVSLSLQVIAYVCTQHSVWNKCIRIRTIRKWGERIWTPHAWTDIQHSCIWKFTCYRMYFSSTSKLLLGERFYLDRRGDYHTRIIRYTLVLEIYCLQILNPQKPELMNNIEIRAFSRNEKTFQMSIIRCSGVIILLAAQELPTSNSKL